MKKIFGAFFLLNCLTVNAQLIDSLNTAKKCNYMKAEEREMIYEINRVRSNPKSYLVYLEPLLKEAKNKLKFFGKGNKNYSVSYISTIKMVSGKQGPIRSGITLMKKK